MGQRLPPEILSKIFRVHANLSYPKHKGSVYPPLRVCSFWRNVAIGTPELWTLISVFRSNLLTVDDEWLSRSKKLPLTISVDLNPSSGKLVQTNWKKKDAPKLNMFEVHRLADDAVNALLARVLACANRWQALKLECKHYVLVQMFRVMSRAHQLQTLTVASSEPQLDIYQVFSDLWDGKFTTLPNLKSLTMNVSPSCLCGAKLDSLETLTLSGVDASAEEIFTQFSDWEMPNLRHIVYENAHSKTSRLPFDLEGLDTSWLNQLERLTHLDPESAVSVFGKSVLSTAPNLKTLVYEMGRSHPDLIEDVIRFAGTVKEVDLKFGDYLWTEEEDFDTPSWGPLDARRFVALFDQVTCVSIALFDGYHGWMTEPYVQSFVYTFSTRRSNGQLYCPRLMELKVFSIPCEIHHILQLYETRKPGRFLVTLKDCPALPDFTAADYEAAKLIFENMTIVNLAFTGQDTGLLWEDDA